MEKHLHTNTPEQQDALINEAHFYLLLKETFNPVIGRELTVSDNHRLPKQAVITNLEVRVGAVQKGETVINSIEDFNKFDIEHEVMHVRFYAIFKHKEHNEQVYFSYLCRLNPQINHKINNVL